MLRLYASQRQLGRRTDSEPRKIGFASFPYVDTRLGVGRSNTFIVLFAESEKQISPGLAAEGFVKAAYPGYTMCQWFSL